MTGDRFQKPSIAHLTFFQCKSMGANDPLDGVIFDPRETVGSMYKDDHLTLLHAKYESSGQCGFEAFLCFSHDPSGTWLVWTPGARLAGFIKRTFIHCYTQNRKALGLWFWSYIWSHI